MEIHRNVRSLSNRPLVPFVALLAAAALGLVAWHGLTPQQAPAGQTMFHLRGAEQIQHNQSEQGLGFTSVGREQVAHNRSEEGLK